MGESPQVLAAKGKDARRRTPRTSLAEYASEPDRPDPMALLMSQGASRIAELLPIRYGRMSASPFSFFRGAALLMASDLSRSGRTPLIAQLCGDAHLSNFGAYASPERRLVFDVNDFDETNPGPFEWDVKRLATSFEIACQQNGFDDKARRRIVRTSVSAYRVTMSRLATLGELESWYDHIDVQSIADLLKAQSGKKAAKYAKEVDRTIARAQRHDALQALDKLTTMVDGRRRIIHDPPLIVPLGALAEDAGGEAMRARIHAGLDQYGRTLQSDRRHLLSQFTLVDVAHKVVGVGSVGTRSLILLMTGRDDDDPFFLQFKEAGRSVLEQFTGRSRYQNMGARVVAGQRLMQSTSDIFLGWVRSSGEEERDYYFRQLRDWKLSAEIETMDATAMLTYAKACGATLAKAHARSGSRIALSAYMGQGSPGDPPNAFDVAIADFAAAYAKQNERDFAALTAAIAKGTVEATSGV